MIQLINDLPENNKYFVACSGGVDSMAILHWMAQGGRMPYVIIHVHHNTGQYADDALAFVTEAYKHYCFDLFVKKVTGVPPEGESKEAYWREQRYALFQEVLDDTGKKYPIVLAHNLDDCVEQYIMKTVLRPGKDLIIPYNGPSNTIRPFRTWRKDKIIDYAKRNNIKWIDDPSNKDIKFLRNWVRNILLPTIRLKNPGIYRQVKSLVLKESRKKDEQNILSSRKNRRTH